MIRKSREVPPEMRALGFQSVYRLFDSFGCVSGRHTGLVLFNQMITVTTSAKKQMADICESSGYSVVRYSLNGGGCSGLIGKWEPETHYEPSEGDMTWPLGEDKVFVIDEFTLQHMEDATVDYGGDFMPAFKVGIPDKKSCGCGESFQI